MATTFPVRAQTDPAVKDINELIAVLRKAGKEANLTEKEINELVNSTTKARTVGAPAVGAINKEMGFLNSTIAKVGPGLAALFAVDRIKALVLNVVSVRAEFEKLSAVLTNTLGSQSRAQEALRMIQEIAAKTPFSVLQLTQSYVKLVNQGFKPANAELIKLGDLAAAVGKDFDQLTEAIIDAQTGEFERLKEFGIRASKEGDKVTFTFKGVKQQVDFTAESIREYILSLGDLDGVSGSMAAISETLGGKISNLGDSLDKLANISGSVLSPALGFVIDDLNNIISLITDESLGGFEKLGVIISSYFPATAGLRSDLVAILDKQRELLNAEKERAIQSTVNAAVQSGNVEAYIKALDSNIHKEEIIARIREIQANGEKVAAEKTAKAEEERIKRAKKIVDEYEKLVAALKKFNELDQLQRDARIGAIDFNSLNNVGFNNPATGINVGDLPAEDVPDIKGRSPEEIESDKQNKIQELRQETYDHAIGLGNALFDFYQNQTQRELDLAKGRYDYEIYLAGDNEDAKSKIAKDFQKEQAKLLEKQNKQQQDQALFNILISQGPAVAKTIATSGFPAALPLVALVLAQFGLLLGNQNKVQAPRYAAKGDFDIRGSGTETSDSNPYWLSVHETVEPAHATKKFGELLKPMLDPKFGWADVRNIVDRKLPSGASDAIVLQADSSTNSDLLEEMKTMRKIIQNKRESRFIFDKDGFTEWTGSGNQWTSYVNSRYTPPTR